MNVATQLVLKGLAGGVLVVVFSLVGSVVKPKRFAGLFSAAPSIAIASLIVTRYSQNIHETELAAHSLILGTVAMIVAVLCALPLIERLRAVPTTTIIACTWCVIAVVGYVVVFS